MRILVDLDGVCADFYSRFTELYNRDFDDNLCVSDVISWSISSVYRKATTEQMRRYFDIPGFWLGLSPIKNCRGVLRRLKDRGHDIVIVTAVPEEGKTSYWEKVFWVKQNLPFIGSDSVIAAHRKDLIKGHVLFDDGPHNLAAFPGISCAMDAPYNKGCPCDYRVNDWLSFEKFILRLEGFIS